MSDKKPIVIPVSQQNEDWIRSVRREKRESSERDEFANSLLANKVASRAVDESLESEEVE